MENIIIIGAGPAGISAALYAEGRFAGYAYAHRDSVGG